MTLPLAFSLSTQVALILKIYHEYCDVSENETAQSCDDFSTCSQNGYWQLGKA